MVRGGKRERAGRKTTWESGVKFEETSPIRVPIYIKDKVLEIAHRLDAGEDFDFVSNLNIQQLQDLEVKLSLTESENKYLSDQLENYRLDLETESNILKSRLYELESINQNLSEEIKKLNLDFDTKSKDLQDRVFPLKTAFLSFEPDKFLKSLSQIKEFTQNSLSFLNGQSPAIAKSNACQALSEIEKLLNHLISTLALSENDIPPIEIDIQPIVEVNIKNIVSELKEKVTKSKSSKRKSSSTLNQSKQLNFLTQEHQDLPSGINALGVRKLIIRLSTTSYSFYKSLKKGEKAFYEFSKLKDPDKIGWKYSESDKLYYPVIPDSEDLRTGSD